MSKSVKQTEDSKIVNIHTAENLKTLQCSSQSTKNRTEKNPEPPNSKKYRTQQSKHMQFTICDGKGAESVGLKQKLVNKVKSWNSTHGKGPQGNEGTPKDAVELTTDFEGLTLSPNCSDDELFKADWLKARDSLENLNRNDRTEIVNSKSTHFPSQEKSILNESPCSESQLGTTKAPNSVSKVLAWDPWDKLGRKNKKDSKRKKHEKPPTVSHEGHSKKDHTAGDELRHNEISSNVENIHADDDEEFFPTYEYQPYQPRNARAVDFTNEVSVIYITAGEVVAEAKEPLKKELEQQIRNKEMRRGHYPTCPFDRKRFEEDYMSAWLKNK